MWGTFEQVKPGNSKFKASVRESVKFLRTHGQELINKRRAVMKSGEPFPADILTHIMKCKGKLA